MILLMILRKRSLEAELELTMKEYGITSALGDEFCEKGAQIEEIS